MESDKIKFISWSNTGKQTDFSHFLNYEELTLLNLIAQTYHSGFGYHLDENYCGKDNILCNLSHDIITEVIAKKDESTMVIFDLKLAKKISTTYLLKHKTIILRLDIKKNGTNWHEKPDKVKSTWFRENEIPKAKYWYEFPSGIFISKGKGQEGRKIKLVGPLSDRSYIHVIDEFEEIKLISKEKGSQLTIDDVLFACRGLCADDTHSISSFNVISDNGSVLKLKVNVNG